MLKFERSVSLLAWALNEENLVEEFLDRAFALLAETVVDYEVVFVDDGSTDRTPELLAAYAAREPRLKIVRHDRNYNVGIACRTAINNAGKDFLFWQTVDWSYDLRNLRIFLELLNHFDVVQGIRPVPIRLLSYIPVLRSIYRVNKRSDTFRKAIVSLGNYYLLRLLFGAKFHDFQNVTFYSTKFIHSLSLVARTSFVNPELLLKSYAQGLRMIEVPIPFIPRTQGEAKGTKFKTILRSVIDTFRNWLAWGIEYRCDLNSERGELQDMAGFGTVRTRPRGARTRHPAFRRLSVKDTQRLYSGCYCRVASTTQTECGNGK